MTDEIAPYYDDIGTDKQKLGRKIYHEALSGRRGFRDDQLGIDSEDEIWLEIFEAIGDAALSNSVPDGIIESSEDHRLRAQANGDLANTLSGEVETLKNTLRDVMKSFCDEKNAHAIQDTIWVGSTPIGDFIGSAIGEDFDYDTLHSSPYRCKKTKEMTLVLKGFSLVPKEPTDDQFERGYTALSDCIDCSDINEGHMINAVDSIYGAMIAAYEQNKTEWE